MNSSIIRTVVAAGLGVVSLAGAPALAQGSALPSGTPRVQRSGVPQRDTLMKLMRPITTTITEQRLEDVITFVRDYTGAAIEPLWSDERNIDGLEKDRLVSVRVDNQTVLHLLERVLEKASDGLSENTWQMTEIGECQVGPKSRLNKYRRVQIYDINDLLMEIPEYAEVPQLDLQSVLQSSQGGSGGGRSPFTDTQDRGDQRRRDREDKAQEVIDILVQTVEPEQWVDGGGTGGTVRFWQGTLIVNAPDYMHRQINGYPYWPSRLTQATMVQDRRYVQLTPDTGISTVDGFAQIEASAVVGGQIIRSGPGGGG